MKYTPNLVFREDQAMRTGERVDEILRRLHSEGE
jgi:ribosome-binding factor A